MISSFNHHISGVRRLLGNKLCRGIVILAASLAMGSLLSAQTDPAATDTAPGNRQGRGNRGGRQGNFNPADVQARMLSALREQFDVTNDDEWKLISDRITAVMDLRRTTTTAGFGFRGAGGRGGGGGNNPNRQNRGGATANPEVDALQSALTDKAPDAEIKSRLERLREVRKADEAKLTKAQEDLRAVLTIRQEAVAVMAGLLP